MKYKIGDRVRIKSLDWYNENKDERGIVELSTHVFIPEMLEHCGMIVTIKHIFEDTNGNAVYYMKGIYWGWTDEMIEGLVEEEMKSEDGLLDEYEELTDRAFKGGYEKCKSDIELNGFQLPQGYQFKDENGNVINAQKIVLEKQKKEYPKTYEECAKIMNCPIAGPNGWLFNFDANIKDSYYRKIDIFIGKFTRLLICRDAYWKIAGEEMGLGEPWKPDWEDDTTKYTLVYINNGIEKDWELHINHTLSFPTKEMRDTFYDNFKEEIEKCKELL